MTKREEKTKLTEVSRRMDVTEMSSGITRTGKTGSRTARRRGKRI